MAMESATRHAWLLAASSKVLALVIMKLLLWSSSSKLYCIAGIAAYIGWPIKHLDVQTAFLHSLLHECVNLTQPQGFAIAGNEHLVCLLVRTLYGLYQSFHMWYSQIETHMLGLGMLKSTTYPNLYFKLTGTTIILLILYVDDLLLIGNDAVAIQTL
jgi:hypothetical protein